MQVPLGATPGFSLDGELRFVADYYGVPMSSFSRFEGPPANDRVACARDALCWQLTSERQAPADRVAEWLGCELDTVRASTASHQARINAFNERYPSAERRR